MVRDEVREAIIASLQKNTQPTTNLTAGTSFATQTEIIDESKLSKFELLDLAILKKYSTK